MSEAGDPDGPKKAHAPNYQSLKVEQSLNDATPPPPQEPEPQLTDWEKSEAADAMRLEEMVRYGQDGPHNINDSNDYNRKLGNMGYDELKEMKDERESKAGELSDADQLAEAKRAAAEKMEQRTPPPPPDEPERPETHSKSR